MKVIDLKRYFAEQGCPNAEFAIRRVREAGYIQAGRGGRGGSYSAEVTALDIARILAAAVHPCGPKPGARDLAHVVAGSIEAMANIIGGKGVSRNVDVWNFAGALGAPTITTVHGHLLYEIRALYREKSRTEGVTEMSSLGDAA